MIRMPITDAADRKVASLMTGWQVVLVFVGIPAAVIGLITLTVLCLSQARIPDGIAAAQPSDTTTDGSGEDVPGD